MTGKSKFIGKSLLWSLLLYACIMGIFHYQVLGRLLGQADEVVVTTGSSANNTVTISAENVSRGIGIAGGIVHRLSMIVSKQ